jgi:hypothetical protein
MPPEIPQVDAAFTGTGPVRRLAATGEHSSHMTLFPGTLAGGRSSEHSTDLEQPYISDVVAPIALYQLHQAGQ